MIIHSSGLSKDYISEEKLSFWAFKGSYWALIPMELDIDTGHAHNLGDLYTDLDRDELFPTVYYRDGIAFDPSVQATTVYGVKSTFRLGKMEQVEKNKSFCLIAIYDNCGRTYASVSVYIKFTIK